MDTGTGCPHFFPVDPRRALLRRAGGLVGLNSHPWIMDPSDPPWSQVELTSTSLGSAPGSVNSTKEPPYPRRCWYDSDDDARVATRADLRSSIATSAELRSFIATNADLRYLFIVTGAELRSFIVSSRSRSCSGHGNCVDAATEKEPLRD